MKKLLPLIFLLAAPLHAASPAAGPSISVNYTVVGWGQEISGLKVRMGTGFQELGVIPLFDKGREFKYVGSNKMELFSQTPKLSHVAGKPPVELPVATVEIPSGMPRVMILLAPKGDGYQAIVVPDDLASVPAGQALVMNLCQQPLGIKANQEAPFKLGLRQSKLLRPGDRALMHLDVYSQAGEAWDKVNNFFLPLPPTYQTIVFFFKSDSDYFKNVDNKITDSVQMIVLRHDLKAGSAATPVSSASPAVGNPDPNAATGDQAAPNVPAGATAAAKPATATRRF